MDRVEDASDVRLTYDIVTSEIHAACKPEKIGGKLGAVLSRFEFCYPSNFTAQNGALANCQSRGAGEETCGVQVDEDGDLVVPRRQGARSQEVVIIEHQQSTSLLLVGEQVWRGALFLADYLLYSASVGPKNNPNLLGLSKINCRASTNREASLVAGNVDNDSLLVTCNGEDALSSRNEPSSRPSEATPAGELLKLDYDVPPGDVLDHLVDVTGKRVLEVASGVGLTSIVAALVAESVLVTDINRGNILRLIERNLEHNRALIGECEVTVGELDFCNLDTIENLISEGRLRDVDVILAADVVYHNDLTDAFFDAAHRLLSELPCKTLLVALEKRYVFTTTEYDVVAPCYDYFLHCLDRLKAETNLHPRASQLRVSRNSERDNTPHKSSPVSGRSKSGASPELLTADTSSSNGPSSRTSSDSGKLLNGDSVPSCASASKGAEISEALCSGVEVASQSNVADDLTAGISSTCGKESSSKEQHPSSSGANVCGGKDKVTAYQRIEYSLKKLQYDDFPQYFAYDRTKELVLWKISAEVS